ncbi:hypothetical protein ACFQ1E_15610 [Sphingomonas canadensis]|uniref:Homogentisate 1,2-dioxygenase n=1 Tax=Sphingomonas canadensis TaxID=1219257 RepID=A0ABW3HBG5_9SPHN|nr:hypothetical protein [Sphingomonas canadensis]MCW3837370.1 hypothetical protein [Sphingomonas canadensis]
MPIAAALSVLLFAQAVPACAATDAALPPALSGWTAPVEAFGPGQAAVLEVKDGTVEIGFRIETAGRYGIALDQGGWIDVTPLGAAAPLKSAGHGHGPECSTIRKIVQFDLQPGVYRVSLTRLTKPQVKLMLVAP